MSTAYRPINSWVPFVFLLLALSAAHVFAEETEHRFRLTSLFQPDRVEDFRVMMAEKFPGVTVASVDFDTAVATLRFDGEKLFRGANTPEKVLASFSQELRGASRGVFDVRPLSTVPVDQLEEARIPIIGHDCKGCSYGAYLAVTRLEGVEYATASFRTGEILARFDRQKTSVAALETALREKEVATNYRIDAPGLVPAAEMKIVRFTSEERQDSGNATHAIDGDSQTKWESQYSGGNTATHPHELVIDLGKTRTISGFRYLPRQLGNVGQFAETEFYLSDSAENFADAPVAKATFTAAKSAQAADCAKSSSGRFVLVRILSEINGKPNATAAEIAIVQAP